MVPLSVVVCFAVLAVVGATEVEQCADKNIENLTRDVVLTPCKKIPCKLKKGTNTYITVNFTPAEEITKLTNHVTADVFGVNLPFIGVDGSSVCDKIYTEDGTKTECPLKPGTKYVYKDSFPVLSVYPSIHITVHWSLQNGKDDVVCFRVPAVIS